jgi:hypothetical protein
MDTGGPSDALLTLKKPTKVAMKRVSFILFSWAGKPMLSDVDVWLLTRSGTWNCDFSSTKLCDLTWPRGGIVW